ncbi:glycosyl transferase [Acetobacter cibinongensis]|uniref:Glycosyl transferase n=1 Tax=Acetobacter cibinongensis TaxID=146475 RepID=A0ABQ0V7N1_9PROT|nr:glycosyltransferase [Acetobacter cibinongensis NRIC 0482]GEL59537.1 glycosyl transferase [Acetobacter cibinongensis]
MLLTDMTEQQEVYARYISLKFPALYEKTESGSDKNDHPVAVVIPIYSGLEATRICLDRVLRHKNAFTRLILVNDGSPDPAMCHLVKEYDAQFSCITLLSLSENCGFPTAANTGLCARFEQEDVILLNSDTLVADSWVERLQQAAYAAEYIGTVTPFSNNATIFSYPEKDGSSPVPSEAICDRLNTLAGQIWDGSTPDVPTAHGFCMYIKAACLQDTGLLRADIFAQGYGEENDWSRRASALGWRHVACPGVYVGHAESQSFSSVKTDLIARNLKLLNHIHPGYDTLIKNWQDQDPLLPFRRALDLKRLAYDAPNLLSALLVTHNRQGGLTRHVGLRATFYLARNIVPFQLKPICSRTGKPLWQIQGFPAETYPNLIIPRSRHALKALLKSLNCTILEIHSYIGHTLRKIVELQALKIPYDVYIHDYSWFCPRITLTGKDGAYCGEPAPKQCQTCLETCGSNTGETTPVTTLRAHSQSLFHHARTVYAPSHDTVRRIKRQLGVSPVYQPWETFLNTEWPRFSIPSGSIRRTIGILGAIGPEKGYAQVLALARLTAQLNAPLQFVLIGYSCNDHALLETGVVTITGHYKEYEIQGFVNQYAIDWFFMPSIWPETWSYVLTQIWLTEKPAIAYDIGAQAERIKQVGGGMVVPLHLPYPRLLAVLYTPRNAPE